MTEQKIAVVTGANRGLGLEISRQLAKRDYHVIMTARDTHKGAAAAHELQAEKLSVELRKLDVTHSEQAAALATYLDDAYGHVDVLVNNAGVFIETSKDSGDKSADPLRVSSLVVMETLNVNTLGALRVIQALAPLLPAGGRIVNVASWMGQFEKMEGNYLAYRMSKTALNALTRVLALRLQENNIAVNAVCPGWVQTEMGGEKAPLTPEQGADTVVWLATEVDPAETGKFWRRRKEIAW